MPKVTKYMREHTGFCTYLTLLHRMNELGVKGVKSGAGCVPVSARKVAWAWSIFKCP